MVCAGQIAAKFSPAAGRQSAGAEPTTGLRRFGFLVAGAKTEIRDMALGQGFEAVGFTVPGAIAQAGARLEPFLAAGHHGDMEWMQANADRRASPAVLWPQAKSVIALGQNYGPGHDPRGDLKKTAKGVVSVYAQGRDYHDVVKKRLKRVGRWMADCFETEIKVFVDTAPLMEKPLAQAAGLGWQGKHTNLVSPDFGSWLFLGMIMTTLRLEPDIPHADRCGSCRACLDICPTNAFVAPYRLDARACISYLTIEHKGHIAPKYRAAIGNRIYGCDDCLAVCPWNKFAQAAAEAKLQASGTMGSMQLADLAGLDDAGFRAKFAGSPVKRTGRDRFVRNVLIAIGNSGNSGDAGLAPAAQGLLGDPSPLVRGMAVWALGQLLAKAAMRRLALAWRPREIDPNVQNEWAAVLGASTNGSGRNE
ncbi:MAG: tRNA epoxyqueuosine(34) reductase QueG [Alphaproteobacteria bacterium]